MGAQTEDMQICDKKVRVTSDVTDGHRQATKVKIDFDVFVPGEHLSLFLEDIAKVIDRYSI